MSVFYGVRLDWRQFLEHTLVRDELFRNQVLVEISLKEDEFEGYTAADVMDDLYGRESDRKKTLQCNDYIDEILYEKLKDVVVRDAYQGRLISKESDKTFVVSIYPGLDLEAVLEHDEGLSHFLIGKRFQVYRDQQLQQLPANLDELTEQIQTHFPDQLIQFQ